MRELQPKTGHNLALEQVGKQGEGVPASVEAGGPSAPRPVSNTGAQSANTGVSGFQVSIDWLSATLPSVEVGKVLQWFPGTFIQKETYRFGYSVAHELEGLEGSVQVLTGKKSNRNEVHVVVSGGVVSTWGYEKVQAFARFVVEHKGKASRVDVAHDDYEGVVTVGQVREEVKAGRCVRRSKDFLYTEGGSVGSKVVGESFTFGSRQSETFMRVYDKKAEQLGKGKVVEHDNWIRWETEYKGERSAFLLSSIAMMTFEQFREYSVGLLRGAVDFREVDEEMESWEKSRAPLLPWWEQLTEGLSRASMSIKKVVAKIADVKAWAAQSLAPILSVLVASPEAGEKWLLEMVATGPSRWKQRHYDLLQRIPKQTYVLSHCRL